MRTSRMQALVPLASSNTTGVIEGEHSHPSGCTWGQCLAELTPHPHHSRLLRPPRLSIQRTALAVLRYGYSSRLPDL